MTDEEYFFNIDEQQKNKNFFVLIIYDIADNKKRTKLSKYLQGYGFRIQKSAFEAVISESMYMKMLKKLPSFATEDDSIRVYKIIGKGQVKTFGRTIELGQEDVILI